MHAYYMNSAVKTYSMSRYQPFTTPVIKVKKRLLSPHVSYGPDTANFIGIEPQNSIHKTNRKVRSTESSPRVVITLNRLVISTNSYLQQIETCFRNQLQAYPCLKLVETTRDVLDLTCQESILAELAISLNMMKRISAEQVVPMSKEIWENWLKTSMKLKDRNRSFFSDYEGNNLLLRYLYTIPCGESVPWNLVQSKSILEIAVVFGIIKSVQFPLNCNHLIPYVAGSQRMWKNIWGFNWSNTLAKLVGTFGSGLSLIISTRYIIRDLSTALLIFLFFFEFLSWKTKSIYTIRDTLRSIIIIVWSFLLLPCISVYQLYSRVYDYLQSQHTRTFLVGSPSTAVLASLPSSQPELAAASLLFSFLRHEELTSLDDIRSLSEVPLLNKQFHNLLTRGYERKSQTFFLVLLNQVLFHFKSFFYHIFCIIGLSSLLFLWSLIIQHPTSFLYFFKYSHSDTYDPTLLPSQLHIFNLFFYQHLFFQCLKGFFFTVTVLLCNEISKRCRVLFKQTFLIVYFLPWIIFSLAWSPCCNKRLISFIANTTKKWISNQYHILCLFNHIFYEDSHPIQQLIFYFSDFELSVMIALGCRLIFYRSPTNQLHTENDLIYFIEDLLLEILLTIISVWHPHLPIILFLYFNQISYHFLKPFLYLKSVSPDILLMTIPHLNSMSFYSVPTYQFFHSNLLSQLRSGIFCMTCLGVFAGLTLLLSYNSLSGIYYMMFTGIIYYGLFIPNSHDIAVTTVASYLTHSIFSQQSNELFISNNASLTTNRPLSQTEHTTLNPYVDEQRLQRAADLLVENPYKSLTDLLVDMEQLQQPGVSSSLLQSESADPLLFLNRFIGTWRLIKSRSDPMEPVSKVLGVNWAIRRAIEQFTPSCRYTRDGAHITITTLLPMNHTRDLSLYVDGKEYTDSDGEVGSWKTITNRDKDHEIIISKRHRLTDGLKMTETRQLLYTNTDNHHTDPDFNLDILWYLVELRSSNSLTDDIIASSNRYFERIEGPPKHIPLPQSLLTESLSSTTYIDSISNNMSPQTITINKEDVPSDTIPILHSLNELPEIIPFKPSVLQCHTSKSIEPNLQLSANVQHIQRHQSSHVSMISTPFINVPYYQRLFERVSESIFYGSAYQCEAKKQTFQYNSCHIICQDKQHATIPEDNHHTLDLFDSTSDSELSQISSSMFQEISFQSFQYAIDLIKQLTLEMPVLSNRTIKKPILPSLGKHLLPYNESWVSKYSGDINMECLYLTNQPFVRRLSTLIHTSLSLKKVTTLLMNPTWIKQVDPNIKQAFCLYSIDPHSHIIYQSYHGIFGFSGREFISLYKRTVSKTPPFSAIICAVPYNDPLLEQKYKTHFSKNCIRGSFLRHGFYLEEMKQNACNMRLTYIQQQQDNVDKIPEWLRNWWQTSQLKLLDSIRSQLFLEKS